MIPNFQEFIEKTKKSEVRDPRTTPPEIWAAKDWEKISKKETEEILLPYLKFQIQRATKNMPEIYRGYAERKMKISDFSDLQKVPALVKDTEVGFREKITINPFIMLPLDVKNATVIYKSGGTRGSATPTFVTDWDELVESSALKKCFEYQEISSKDTVLNTYNPTHKGGRCITKAITMMGGRLIPRRTTESAKEVIETIEQYNINVLATVQGPITEGDKTKKGSGIDFLALVEAGQDTLEKKIDKLFITGYTLIPEVIAWAEANGKKLATALGSSEALPQATSTTLGRICKHNNLHLINGPHYTEIVKQESGELVPVKRGETGILAYTTIAREGTIYIRYAPGDSARLVANPGECGCGIKTPIISEIKRIDIPEDTVATGCVIG